MDSIYKGLVVITDCLDPNARGRQEARLIAYFGCPVTFIGVKKEVEAAGNLIDILDATEGNRDTTIVVNVAPRNGDAQKRHKNGTPFGYFTYRDRRVVTSVDGLTLSLAKKLGVLAGGVTVLDTDETVGTLVAARITDEATGERIKASQFRSFDFLPLVARYLDVMGPLQGERLDLKTIPKIDSVCWWTDCFGNIKTTLLPEDWFEEGREFVVNQRRVTCYRQLRSVPSDGAGLIIGSSGIGNTRFVELVVNGGNASQEFGINSGDAFIRNEVS